VVCAGGIGEMVCEGVVLVEWETELRSGNVVHKLSKK